MADVYVRSGAAGAGTGADWANAYTTLGAALAAKLAGDDFWVSEDHAETQASANTLVAPGTSAAPNRIICVDHLGSVPPVSADLRTTATISTTGNNSIALQGSFYCYGITFSAGNSTGTASIFVNNVTGETQSYEACLLKLNGTGGASVIVFGSTGAPHRATLVNTAMSFGAVGQGIEVRSGTLIWRDTPSAILGSVPTTLFKSSVSSRAGVVYGFGLDLSAAGAGKTLVGATGGATIAYRLANCRLGASVTPAAVNIAAAAGDVHFINCDSAGTGYQQAIYAYTGTLTPETTIVIGSGGASDGTQAISWKIAASANAKQVLPFETFAYQEWIDTTGSPITRTFELVNDGVTLTNAELWAEAHYLGSSADPIDSVVSSGPADPLAAGANLTSSAVSWTTTGLASPVTQKIAVTFTPETKGWVDIVFKAARASQTVYLNPRPNEV